MWNPKLRDWLETYKEQSIISFAWSIYWRLSLVMIAVYFAIGFLVIIVGVISSFG